MKILLTDIGGVLLTNGWDGAARKRAIAHFSLDPKEVDERHRQIYDTYESGKIALSDYLQHVIFYEPRPFSESDFYAFMQQQSAPLEGALELYRECKEQGVQIGAISNEGKDLGSYRVQKFNMREFIDFFVISGFVGLRKPDPEIFTLALGVAQVNKEDVLYVDDRELLVSIAKSYGIPSYQHVSVSATREFFRAKFSMKG